MKIKKRTLYKLIFVLLLLNCSVWKGNAQYSGSLMMLQDNYYSQMMNPAYMRKDQAVTLAVPGLAGFSFKNTGTFRISDIISVSTDRVPELDFGKFYEKSKPSNFIGANISVPLIFISTPAKNGFFTFYYQERSQLSGRFGSEIIDYINSGNIRPGYQNFSAENINFVGMGIKDFAFSYAQNIDEDISIGIRGKILFSNLYYSAKDWKYGVITSESGDKATLTATGSGKMYLPVPVYLSSREQVFYIDGSNLFGNYINSFSNPGLAFDFGITWNLGKSKMFSFAIRDLGGIWFRKDGIDLTLNNSYDFVGFDLENAVRFLEQYGYVNPLTSVLDTKEEVRNVYRPFADSVKFAKPLPPQMVLHYQIKSSKKLEFGITNQSIFQRKLFFNALTFTALQKKTNFSIFESINIHQLSSVSIGGGFQYTGKRVQFTLASDNLIAFYHPAKNKTFSLTMGMCFLFNHEKNQGDPNGRFLPHLPFHRILD